jgi:hypothetical protein
MVAELTGARRRTRSSPLSIGGGKQGRTGPHPIGSVQSRSARCLADVEMASMRAARSSSMRGGAAACSRPADAGQAHAPPAPSPPTSPLGAICVIQR